MRLKKKFKITLIIILIVLIITTLTSFALLFYKNSLESVGSSDDIVTFTINNGTSSKTIIDDLYDAKLIKNKNVGYIYLKLHKNILLQAGVYELNRGMSMPQILESINNGDVVDNSVTITFVEGKRITYYATQIAQKLPFTEEEVLAKINDSEFINQLVNEYWFLTDDIKNDKLYYALEGYLYPDTYQFDEDATLEDVIKKLLSRTDTFLTKYKEAFESNKYSIHEILTMASIVELEGANSDDRASVAGVFYNRLNAGWNLGSDVTTYYAAKIDMATRDLYQAEIEDKNDYNTRSDYLAGKLPVGPICNPSSESILATLEYKEHNYFYFVADKNKHTYFATNYDEFLSTINKLKNEGLWYEYK